MHSYTELGADVKSLPCRWSMDGEAGADVHSNVREFLRIEGKGTQLKYVGPGKDDAHAASCRADKPVPSGIGIYFYEVEIKSKGRDGYIGVGFAASSVPLNRLPGWESKSYGYHGDDGHAFESSGKGKAFGPTFTTGDVIGVLLNQIDRTISYFKNGVYLGVAFGNVTEERLYPCVGMRTELEHVEANFLGPFVADFVSLRRAAQRRLLREVAGCALPLTPAEMATASALRSLQDSADAGDSGPSGRFEARLWPPASVGLPVPERDTYGADLLTSGVGEGRGLVLGMCLDYLAHHGYLEAAQALARESGMQEMEVQLHGDLQTTTQRQELCRAVVAGHIDDAIAMCDAISPAILSGRPGLRFRLQVQCFVEMMRGGRHEDAQSYALRELGSQSRNSLANALRKENRDLLESAMTLLAYYDNPQASPVGHLLRADKRAALAEEVSRAVLEHGGHAPRPAIEVAARQAVLCVEEGRRLKMAKMGLIDLRDVLGPGWPGEAERERWAGPERGAADAVSSSQRAGDGPSEAAEGAGRGGPGATQRAASVSTESTSEDGDLGQDGAGAIVMDDEGDAMMDDHSGAERWLA